MKMVLLDGKNRRKSKVKAVFPDIEVRNSTDAIRILNLLKSPTTRRLLMLRVKQIETVYHEELTALKNNDEEFKKALMPFLDNDPRLVDYVVALVEFPDFREDKVRDFEVFYKDYSQIETIGE